MQKARTQKLCVNTLCAYDGSLPPHFTLPWPNLFVLFALWVILIRISTLHFYLQTIQEQSCCYSNRLSWKLVVVEQLISNTLFEHSCLSFTESLVLPLSWISLHPVFVHMQCAKQKTVRERNSSMLRTCICDAFCYENIDQKECLNPFCLWGGPSLVPRPPLFFVLRFSFSAV